MKKIAFYTTTVIAIILLVNIIQIVATDFDRLTEYGYGYLIGKIILFVVFSSIAFLIQVKRNKE